MSDHEHASPGRAPRPTPDYSQGGGGVIGWWARNSVAANLLMVIAIVGGFIGYMQMERLVFPSAAQNVVTIDAFWQGASPQELEEQILVRVEEAVADLEGIVEITARASENSGFVRIEANRSIDMQRFVNDVKLRVDAINNLPPAAERLVVRQNLNENWFMGMALHGDIDLVELKRLADEIRDEVSEEVYGASRAIVSATLGEEVSIEISDEKLREFGLTFDEVANAIRAESVNVGGGSVRTESGNVSVAVRNQANTAEDFENIIVRQTEDSATLYVRDIGTVNDGFVDANFEATFNGEPMAIIALRSLENDMNVVRTQRELKEYIESKQAELQNKGVTLTLWWDDSEAFFARTKTVLNSAAIGLMLVTLVLILFLRPIVAFWTGVGIATAFFGAVAILPLMGVSLNMLSLFAFLLVIGIVVDDAIIVGENIHNRVERGERGVTASIIGTQLVAKPVVFAVLTTMMAFAPWMMLTGPEVQFTRQISLVVIAALSFSLIESLLILPNHLAHLKPQRTDGPFGGLIRFQQRFANALMSFAHKVYRPLVTRAIQARYATVALFIAIFVVSIATLSMGFVRSSFLPDVEQDFIFVQIEMADGTPYSRIMEIKDQLVRAEEEFMEDMNARYPDQPIVQATSAFSFDDGIQAWISLHPAEDRPQGISTKDISERLRELLGPIPDAEEVNFISNFNNNQSRIVIVLQSDNLEQLRAAAGDVKTYLSSFDTVFDVRDSLQSAADEAQLQLLPGARSLDLDEAEVSRQLFQAFNGAEAQRLPRNGEDVRVVVRLSKSERESLETLETFRLRLNDGREVPLAAVADVDFGEGISSVQRRNRSRSLIVTADVAEGGQGAIYQDLGSNYFPQFDARFSDVTRIEGGDREDQQNFVNELFILSLIVLAAMYFLLAIAFRAIFQPLLVMIAIPFCLIGAIVGSLVFNTAFGLFSFFGIVAAAGVVINDNLVLIDYVNRLRREGMSAFNALIEAGVARFRPILLTSVTTFLGILPMMAERSTQAQFLQPMVVALGFAVVFALFLTLFLVPALYAVGSDIGRYVKWMWGGKRFVLIGRNEPSPAPAPVTDDGVTDDGGAAGARPLPAE